MGIQGGRTRGMGSTGPHFVRIKLPSLCVSPVDYKPGRASKVQAVLFIPHSTFLSDGTDIGGYTALATIADELASSLLIENKAVIPVDRAECLTLTREGSPRITLDPVELSNALRDRRNRLADALARRTRIPSERGVSNVAEDERTQEEQRSRASSDARGEGGGAA